MRLTLSPFAASAAFLAFTLAGAQLIQGVGHVLNLSLVAISLPLAASASLALTYGYFFSPTRLNRFTLLLVMLLLAGAGVALRQWYDMTADGMGYQQPGAEAILGGLNPLYHHADMLWLNLYPSGAWELEASLAWLYGSIENARTLHVWWLFIAVPILFAGIAHHKQASLTAFEKLLAGLAIFGPVVLSQLPTHYVDAMLYLSGVSFVGALLLYGSSPKQNLLSLMIMGGCVCFMVNAKLSGIYHAFALCSAALLYCGMTLRRIPYRPAFALLAAGLVATLFLGFHPYITNFLKYGSLLHMDANIFTGYQRPADLADMNRVENFFYSLFSVTGGAPRADAQLKLPWQIQPSEWLGAGTPDPRSGGFGVLFALGFLASAGVMALHLRKADRRLLALGGMLLLSSLLFLEGWWARYVPFAYLSVFIFLLSLPARTSRIRYIPGCIFIANSLIAAYATLCFHLRATADFDTLASQLRRDAAGVAYLVPPGDDYLIYNHAHMPLARRLNELGVTTSIRVDAPCPRLAATISEFKVCY